MKINFDAKIHDLDGDVVQEDGKDVTLGKVLCRALLAAYPDEANLSGEEKVKRFRIAEATVKGGEQDIKIDDIALVKRLVAKAYGPLVVGRVYDIIEPPAKG